MDRADCISKIRPIYSLISTKGKLVDSCSKPTYARITLSPDSAAYGEPAGNESEVYDVDYTGACVTRGPDSYRIKRSIFGILDGRPIRGWGVLR